MRMDRLDKVVAEWGPVVGSCDCSLRARERSGRESLGTIPLSALEVIRSTGNADPFSTIPQGPVGQDQKGFTIRLAGY